MAAAEEQREVAARLQAELAAVRAEAEAQSDALKLKLAEARAEAEASRGQVRQERLRGTLVASEAWVDAGFNSHSPGGGGGAAAATPSATAAGPSGVGTPLRKQSPGGEAAGTPSPSQMSSFMSDASSLGDSPESQYMMLNTASGVLLLRKELESQMQLVTKVREENISLASQVESLTMGNTALATKFKATLTKLTAALKETEDVKTQLLLKEQAHRATLNALKQALQQKEEDLAATAQARAEALKKVIELQQEGGAAAEEAGELHEHELQAEREHKALLESKLAAVTGKLESATGEREKAVAELATAEGELSALRQEKTKLRECLESAAAAGKSAKEQFDAMRGEARRHEESCRALGADLEARGRELSAAAEARETAESARLQVEEEVRRLRGELQRVQEEASTAAELKGTSLESLQSEIKSLAGKASALSESNTQLLGERSELQKQLTDMQQAAVEHKCAAENWTAEKAQLAAAQEAERLRVASDADALVSSCAGLTQERDAARADLSRERSRMSDLLEQFSQAKDALATERDELQGRLGRVEAMVRHRGAEEDGEVTDELAGLRADWEAERESLSEQLTELLQSNADLQEERTSLLERLDLADSSARESLEDLQCRLEARETEIGNLKVENDELAAESQTAMEMGVTLARISEKLEQQMNALNSFQEMDAENSELREKLALATASKAAKPSAGSSERPGQILKTPSKASGCDSVGEASALMDKFSEQFERLRNSPQAAAATSPEKAALYSAALQKLEALKSENGTLWNSLNEQARAANKLADRAVSDAALCESMDRERQKLLTRLEGALQEKAAMAAQIARSDLVMEQLQRTITRLGAENSELSESVAALQKSRGGSDAEGSAALARVSGERDQVKLQLMQASHRLARTEVDLKAKVERLHEAEKALELALAAPSTRPGGQKGGPASQDLVVVLKRLREENAFLKSRCEMLDKEATNLKAELVQKDMLAQRVAMEEKAQATPGPSTPGLEASVACQTPATDRAPQQRTRRNSAPGDVGADSGDRLHIIRALKAQTLKSRHYKARIVSLEEVINTLRTKHMAEMKRLEKKLQPTVKALDQLTRMQSPVSVQSRPSTAPLSNAGGGPSKQAGGKRSARAAGAQGKYGAKTFALLKTTQAPPPRGAWK